mgnify:CR=1 FL=1
MHHHCPCLFTFILGQSETVSWDTHKLQKHLGADVCQNILFIHAILGCDTTSKVYGFGKCVGLKLFKKCESFRSVASVFNMFPDMVSKEYVIQYGEQALVFLYKGTLGQSVNNVRLSSFVEKVAKTSMYIDPKQLPPTSDAEIFHSLHVYTYTGVEGVGAMHLTPWNGDGKMWTISSILSQLTGHQLQTTLLKSCVVRAQLGVKHKYVAAGSRDLNAVQHARVSVAKMPSSPIWKKMEI